MLAIDKSEEKDNRGIRMAEQKRGKPMIYGKSPGSRKYWDTEVREKEEQKRTTGLDQAGASERKKETGRADSAGGSKKTAAISKKEVPGRLHLHKKTTEVKEKTIPEKKQAVRKKSTGGENPESAKQKRVRSRGNQKKLKVLWMIFAMLCVLLVAAIVYEIVLGNGTKLPGSRRITQPTRQEQNKETTGILLHKKTSDTQDVTEAAAEDQEARQTVQQEETADGTQMKEETQSSAAEAKTEAADSAIQILPEENNG